MNTWIYGKGSYFRQSLQTSFYIFLQSDLSFTLFFLPFSSTVILFGGEILCPSLISCFGISIQAASFLSAIHAFTCQIVNSMRKSPIARQEKEGNVQTLRRKLYLCSNIRVLCSYRDIHIWAGCKVTCRFACEKEVIMFTFGANRLRQCPPCG